MGQLSVRGYLCGLYLFQWLTLVLFALTPHPTPTLRPVFEEPEDPSNRSFFSEIISSISDVKFSHNGRYMMTRDYLSVKIWDLNMENRPVETYQVRHTCAVYIYVFFFLILSVYNSFGFKFINISVAVLL